MKKFLLFISVLLFSSLVIGQNAVKPLPAHPFDNVSIQSLELTGSHNLINDNSSGSSGRAFDGGTLQSGGDRLVAMQNSDGGWAWPLTGPIPSPLNTLGPIAKGLAQAYKYTGDADQLLALQDAAAYLLTKTNNFSPSDGYLAKALDEVFGVTTYVGHLNTNFYGPLSAGTYNRNGAGTLYNTESYINLIRANRAGAQANLAAWDVGMGLVGAVSCGVTGFELGFWIDGTKAEINELNSTDYYDVIGLAGALYGLAFVDATFDPTAGAHVAASSIQDLAVILASYQINNGGFTWNSAYVIANDNNESIQETSYAILALNEVNRSAFMAKMQGAADYITSVQNSFGGWANDQVDLSENNEVTGEALWGYSTVYTASGPKTTIGSPISLACDLYDVPVTVQDFTNVGIISLILNYDKLVFECQSVDINSAISSPIFDFDNTTGKFLLSYYGDGITLAEDAVLFTLHFKLLPAVSGTTTKLEWSKVAEDCQYGSPSAEVYGSSFFDLTPDWTIPVRPVVNVNTAKGFCTIQDAIDGASANDAISVYPGNYSETASNRTPVSIAGTYTFGLYISPGKNGITIQGVDASGVPIINYTEILANVETNATNNFGPDGIFMEGDNVTITGLKIWQNPTLGLNKTISVIGDNFTLKYCNVTDISATEPWASVYIDDEMFNTGTNTSHIQSYTIEGNWLNNCSIDPNNGAGYSGLVTGRKIINNKIQLGSWAGASISFSGSGTGVPWFIHGVGGAIITGNTFSDNAQHIRVRGDYDNSQFNWSSYWNDNTFDKAVITGINPTTDVREYSYMGGFGLISHVRRIGAVIQSEINNVAQANDVIKVAAGTYIEGSSPLTIDKNLTLLGASKITTFLKPATNTTLGGNVSSEAFIYIAPGANVVMKNFTVDCDGKQVNHAIQSRGALDIEDCDIKNVKYDTYAGRGIVYFSGTTGNLVKNVTFTNIERIGIHVRGGVIPTAPVVNIDHVTYTGKGNSVPCLDYAVEFGGGGGGAVDYLTATNCTGLAYDGSTSAAIMATTYFGSGTNATITHSTLTGNTTGIAVGYDESDASIVVAHNNHIENITENIVSTAPSVDATCNWYGTSDYNLIWPKIVGDVDFVPYLVTNDIATPVCSGAVPPVHNVTQNLYFNTIQTAIDAVATTANDVIEVSDGTYNESPDVTKSLTIKSVNGRNATTIVLQPGGGTYVGSLQIGAPTVVIDGFTITGYDGGAGLACSNFTITSAAVDVTIKNNKLEIGSIGAGSNGDDGIGIVTYYSTTTDFDLLVDNNLFEPLNTNGYRAFYINPGVNDFNFTNNTINGEFTGTAITQAKNGLVKDNIVTGTGTSAGIGTWGYPDETIYGHTTFQGNTISSVNKGIAIYNTNHVTLTGNTITTNNNGVWIGNSGGTTNFDPLTILINNNKISGNTTFGVNNTLTTTVDATNNWWGDPSGPYNDPKNICGSGNAVSSFVNFIPWYSDAAMTTLYSPPAPTEFGGPVPIASTVECESAAIAPALPDVNDYCGTLLSPTGYVVGGVPETCEGSITYTYTYTDALLQTLTWVYTYTIDHTTPPVVPAAGASTVACLASAVPPPSTPTLDQQQTQIAANPNWIDFTSIGQSFTCGATGSLTKIDLQVGSIAATQNFILNIYQGNGISGTLLYSGSHSLSATGWQSLNIDQSLAPYLTAGTQYTFWLTSFTYNQLGLLCMTPSTYNGGVAMDGCTSGCSPTYAWQQWPAYDLVFKTYMTVVPIVTDICGVVIPTPVPVESGTYVSCEGTKVYTYNYTDCSGLSTPWVYTYTIERNDFSMPANGSSTVACIALATQPTPPSVTDNCGNTLTPTGPTTGGTYIDCEGTRTFTWTYADCEGNTHNWVYTYTIERLDFIMPANPALVTVACYAAIAGLMPTPPAVTDNCGNSLTPSVPVESTPPVCEGDVTYTWTYTDCELNTHNWVATFTIDYSGALTPPANGSSTVSGPAQAVNPGAPAAILDACGRIVNAVLVGSVSTPDPIVCEGTVVWTYRYTACDGITTADWTYTYTIVKSTLSGTLKYNNGPKTAMNNVTLQLTDGVSIWSNTTDGTGAYSFTDLCPGTYTITVTNNNKPVGGINSTDAGAANYWSTHFVGIEHVKFLAGDVTNDNFVSSTDALKIQRYFVFHEGFARAPWSFWKAGDIIPSNTPAPPTSFSVSVTGNVANYDLYAMCTGDFNGSFTPSAAKSSSSSMVLTSEGTMVVSENQEFDLPVRVASAMDVSAVSMILDIPSDMVEVQDVVVNGSADPVTWTVNGNELRIGWNSTLPVTIPADGSLLTLKLKTTNAFTSGNSILLNLVADPLNELADGNYNVIENAVLVVNQVDNGMLGIPALTGTNLLSLSNYPNPFNGSTTVTYEIPYDGKVTLEVNTMLGQKVISLVDKTQSAGKYTLMADGSSLQPGFYSVILRLKTNDGVMVRTIKFIVNQ